MKKLLTILLFSMLTLGLSAQGDYASLWKIVEKAQEKDQPKTALSAAKKIEAKAEKEKHYGHLFAALFTEKNLLQEISRDSIAPMEKRMEAKYQELTKKDPLAACLYQVAVNKAPKGLVDSLLYHTNPETVKELTKENGSLKYIPFITKGIDSKYFNHSLIGLIAYSLGDYASLARYYSDKGNRKAACIAYALQLRSHFSYNEKKTYLNKADSLINIYKDLPECGALAVAKADLLPCTYPKEKEKVLEWIDESLTRWSKWQEMNELRNKKNDLTQPSISLECNNDIISGKAEARFYLNKIRNVSSVTITATPIIGLSSKEISEIDLYSPNTLKALKPHLQTGKKTSISKRLKEHKHYEIFKDTLSIGKLPLGAYLIQLITDEEEWGYNKAILIVSDLEIISLRQGEKQTRYVVVDKTSGQPVTDAKLHFLDSKAKEIAVMPVNEQGEYIYNFDEDKKYLVYATTDEDKAQYAREVSTYYNKDTRDSIENRIEICTDRTIYRPGQTVHVSVLAHDIINGTVRKVATDKKISIILNNADGDEIDTTEVTTDEFGTATTDFILPAITKNGEFSIEAEEKDGDRENYREFIVEEYKRPTFDITINKPEIEYKDGDTITVTGIARTYSGVGVSNANVAYSVYRRQAWWWSDSSYDSSHFDFKDTVQTDFSGNFKMRVPMILPERNRVKKDSPYRWCPSAFYDINIEVEITDNAGETHNAQLSLPLCNRSSMLSSNIKDKYLNGEKPIEVIFTRRNNAGTEIAGEATIEIDGKVQEKAICGKPYIIPKSLPSGPHSIRAICDNDTVEGKFVLFSLEDKAPIAGTHDWWYQTSNKFPVTIQYGTVDRNVHVVYAIFSGDKLIESGTEKLDSSLITKKFEYKEEYGNSICYTIAWVKNGKTNKRETIIERPLPNGNLKTSWKSFRNKLEPGQKEEWQLCITDTNNKPVKANVMAVLYDMSLDALSHDIGTPNMFLYDPRHIYQRFFRWTSSYTRRINRYLAKPQEYLNQQEFDFSHFTYGLIPSGRAYLTRSNFVSKALNSKAAGITAKQMQAKGNTLEEVNVLGYATHKKANLTGSVSVRNIESDYAKDSEDDVLHEVVFIKRDYDHNEDPEAINIRTNLNELAFFMPQLRTDDKGIATLAFTLPESVTTWKFMALAHDKELRSVTRIDKVIAQKKLMIQPRLPRFLREGDVTDIPASVSNLTEKDITANVKFTILDAKTEKVLSTQSKKITVKGGETEAVAFAYDTKNQEDKSIIVRYTVSGKSEDGSFSDGEQKDLPILSQKELMVNTQTFILTEAGEKQFDLKKIIPSVNEKKLTVEYTDSPEWLMIKALPYISKANDENAICLSSAYYANSIASSITHTNPEIRKAVSEWNSEELNQLFDSISLNYHNTDVLDRLSKLQNANGSWSWWKGMEGSTHMTVSVLKTLLRLNLMLNDEKVEKENEPLIKRAFNYLDKETNKRVAEMKKEKYKYLPSYALDYLYCRAIAKASGTKINSNSSAEYLLKLVPEETLYDDMQTKAQAAIILSFAGNKSKASEFIKSIIEHTVYREDLGRYFDSERARYSWCDYKIPTQVSVIEALKLIDSKNSAKEIADMKRWLLQSKRTQSWDTPINAINAIYAFLCPSQGTTSSLRKGVPADIALGKTRMPAQEYTSALGYVKTSKDITSKDNTLTVTKHTNGESWTNVFIEYKQAATESEASSTGLSITRKVETNGKNLKVGDKVEITITITADRDYDFVTVTDNRPACLEPVEQLSGYRNGSYRIVRDTKTEYCYNMMRKGTHVIKTSYYVARNGNYTSGTATATCTYSPVFTGRTPGSNYVVK